MKKQTEDLDEVVDGFKRLDVAGEGVGFLGEFWNKPEIDDEVKIICDVGVTWKNYVDMIYEGLRLRELSLKEKADKPSKLLEILGSHPNCLTLCLTPDGNGGVRFYLKPAIPILELFKYEIKEINLLTELVYYKLLHHFEKLGDVEILYTF